MNFSLRTGMLGALVLGLCACATPMAIDNGREGILDKMAEMDRAREDGYDFDSAGSAEGDLARYQKFYEVPIQWPVRNPVLTSPFGQRGRDFHEGVDLRAGVGTSVYAAHDGRVVYSGRRIRGYGRMVVIQHPSGLTSIYAHNSRLFVKRGKKIKRGQKIALSGRSGRVTGPHVHFELRDGSFPLNPEKLIHAQYLARSEKADSELGPILKEKKPKRSARKKRLRIKER